MTISENLLTIRSELRRFPAAQLVAVSKQQNDEVIDEALQAGQRIFGENRVQEAHRHWADKREAYPDVQLHLIGPLQSNKAAEAVALFDVIQTIDREKIAVALDGEMQKQQRSLPCFIQVNTGEEPQKAGIMPDALGDFITFCHTETKLTITGLMCIPPVAAPAALHFLLLRKLAARHDLPHVSMGMSDDYLTALRCGATHIRVGSGIFGSRSAA
ncbi:MAG TPA: YggS family pyridoxal phosphate-dependent enzyme [Alphaproteobacteria bacterium]